MSRKRQNQILRSNRAANTTKLSGKRLWLFRLAALVLVPLLAFLCLEGVLWLAGYGYSTRFFLNRTMPDGRKVAIENEKFGRPFFGPAARIPAPMALLDKPEHTYRVFVFGESAAYGDPQPEFGLCRMLETQLGLRYPGTRFEVVNVAMTAINSHVILPIARECAAQKGDLWVIYMGNNEVVGPYGSGTVFGNQTPPLPIVRASIALKRTRTGQWLESVMKHDRHAAEDEPEWTGMLMFLKQQVSQDDPKMERVYSHFASNLRDIIAAGATHGAKVVVSTVACNLADCPPFASAHRKGLTDSQRVEWDRLLQAGADAESADKAAQALGFYRAALKIDDQFAELRYRAGSCYVALGQESEGQKELSMARDLDTLRFRADNRINDLIRQGVSGREKEGILLADSERELARRSPHELCGTDFFYEHVHLTFEGNYWLARSIADQAASLLPPAVTRQAATNWPTISECAQRLCWTDWNRNEAVRDILKRISDPPFSTQIDHEDQLRRSRDVIEKTSGPEVARQAFVVYKQALGPATNDWQLMNTLARLAGKVGDLPAAVDAWRKVNELLPLHAPSHFQLGQVLNRQQKSKEAEAEFETALRIKPDYSEALVGLGIASLTQGKMPLGLEQYEKALKLKPHSVEAHLNMAAALESMGRTAEAESHYRAATDHKPLNVELLLTLGRVCVGRGWADKALEKFAMAVRLDPGDGRAHFYLASALTMAGHREEALPHFKLAVKLSPDMAEAHLGLGIELGKQGDHAGATQQFAEAVRLNSNLLEARLNLAMALSNLGKREEAVAEYRDALRIDPKNAAGLAGMERLGKP